MPAHDNEAMTSQANVAAQTPEPSGMLRLTDWGVIRARGEDAKTFLHGQLTNDMQRLDAASARLAGYCSPKGRLLATFVAWQGVEGEVLLACSADLLPQTLKRLSMFVMRAKCRLDDASAEWPVWGLAGAGPVAAAAAALGVPADATAWRHHPTLAGSLITLPTAGAGAMALPRALFVGKAPPALPALAPEAWAWLEVMSGVPRVVAATVEQFVPQMVNLELVGGVDFKKGCYPGQEVVARSQYRGTLKRRSYVLTSAQSLLPGDEIFDASDPGQPAGMVVLSGRLDAEVAALVELKIAAHDHGAALHARSADGPALQAGTLPYAIPTEAT